MDERFTITESDLLFLNRLATLLYSENRMTGDQMRDNAQRLDSILKESVGYGSIGKVGVK
jgi:hypothetical protein